MVSPQKVKRNGIPKNLFMKIIISNCEVLIDDEDYENILKHKWYSSTSEDKNRIYFITKTPILKLHRFIINAKFGEIVDHINGNTLDNRKCNLRICTNQQNLFNSKLYKTNTSGFKGVSWAKRQKKWHVTIMINGKTKHIGYFSDKKQAVEARNEVAKKYHKEFYRKFT